ncbi:D-alanyl-D-alanine carboxypeptidase family protein [Flavimaricola marinus]|nr:D-alanyl-D-alanine carboxypeptidase family protein [Flavimaricola marinus]
MIFVLCAGALAPTVGKTAPYAAMVMDARTGEVLHSRNADTRLHPASLTKMMTIYIAFQAIQRGEISLDTEVTITSAASSEPPSKLGLRTGQTIRLRYLIRAAAVKSANDAATAIGIAIGGSEEAFAARMNATAQAMGMTSTTFRNMHGLTESGHMSTARDMSVLGRHIIYDYPQYYNLFSRRSADAGIAQVNNTNRRFLDSYEGADGIKTGFTNAAGYNLVASAQRGQVRIIATVFGGTSTANRNARVAELLDMGFARAPGRATVRAPALPAYRSTPAPAPTQTAEPELVAGNQNPPTAVARTIRVSGQVQSSIRPEARPSGEEPVLVAAATEAIDDALALALAAPAEVAETATEVAEAATDVIEEALPETAAAVQLASASELAPATIETLPEVRPAEIIMTAADIAPANTVPTAEPEVVTRISTSGGRHWGINVGRYGSRYEAERTLIQVALSEPSALDGALRRILQRSGGFDANFMGLTREGADLACRRLQARGTTCFMIGTDES